MRTFGRSRSSHPATISSRSLRVRLRRVSKNRFLASCWVMVLPPRRALPFLTFASTDSWIAFQSTPS